LNTMGAAYKDMGEYNSATEHFRRALTIYRELLGDLHPDTVNAINNLASTLAVNQELKEALHLLEVCLKTLPLDHIYYGKISDHRRRLLQKPIQKGFRQPAANSATKKAPHKKRKSR
jgi:tetratricopeptide (TPR) repeat protein